MLFTWRMTILALALTVAGCGGDDKTSNEKKEVPVPAPATTSISQVATTGDRQVTGVAVSPTGRIFVCFPYWAPGHTLSVAELGSDGVLRPYPNQEWNSWGDDTAAAGERFVCVQSVYVDRSGFLWILDPASPMMAGVVPGGAKLLKVDLNTNQIVQTIRFDESVAPKMSYLNDVRVDVARNVAYMTESGLGAVVVTDLATGASRRLLADHPSTKLEADVVPVIEGKELRDTSGQVPKIHADGIALDKEGSYLYYKALVGRTLYRIAADKLRDASLDGGALAQAVENLGRTVVCDGMIMDDAGNLYMTAIEENGVRRRRPDGTLEQVVSSPSLKWPDTFAFDPDGALLVTASMIHLAPKYNGGVDKRTMPYALFKVKL